MSPLGKLEKTKEPKLRRTPWYLGKFDKVSNENQMKAYLGEDAIDRSLGQFATYYQIYFRMNVPREVPNSDNDAIISNCNISYKKLKSEHLLRRVEQQNGKATIIEVKNITTKFYFSEKTAWKLVVTRYLDADPAHKHPWILIIPKLNASKKVWKWLETNGVEVIETKVQLLPTDNAHIYKRKLKKWLKTLKKRLWTKLKCHFRLYNKRKPSQSSLLFQNYTFNNTFINSSMFSGHTSDYPIEHLSCPYDSLYHCPLKIHRKSIHSLPCSNSMLKTRGENTMSTSNIPLFSIFPNKNFNHKIKKSVSIALYISCCQLTCIYNHRFDF